MTPLKIILDVIHNPVVHGYKKGISREVLQEAVVEYIDLQEAKKAEFAEKLNGIKKHLKNGQLLSSQNALSELVDGLAKFLSEGI